MLGPTALQQLLQNVLRQSSADETEIAFTATQEALTRFAHNSIHQNVAESDVEVEVRAAFGQRVGRALTNDLTPVGLERALTAACDLAQHLPPHPEWPGLADPVPPAAEPQVAFDEAVAGMSPAARAAHVAAICRAAHRQNLWASGAFSTTQTEAAVLNSKGLWAYAPNTQIDLTLVMEAKDETASAYAEATGWRLEQVNAEALTAEALERLTLAQRRPMGAVVPGEYPVVFEPYAVVVLLEALAGAGMGALAVQEERSWMNHRWGQPTLAPQLTIVDDAFDPEGVPQAFDCEGVPKQRVEIVQAGRPLSPVYDRWTAAREPGRHSTGHAQPWADEDWDGPLPENLTMAPGADNLATLIGRVTRGLYISRLWYVNLTTPHDCGITGTTRDGVWWIENGELAYPVANLRFDQALVPALRGITGLGQERRTLTGFFGGVHRVPALTLESFRFIDS